MNDDTDPTAPQLSAAGINHALAALIERGGTRSSALLFQVFLDVAYHPGTSPAEVGERLLGDRNSSTIHSMAKKLVSWGWMEQVDVPYHSAQRRQLNITAVGFSQLLQPVTP